MKRRVFVKYGAVSLCAAPVLSTLAFRSTGMPPKPTWLVTLIKANDKSVVGLKKYRISDTESPAFGGFMDGVKIPNPHSTVAFIRAAGCALVSSESTYYRSEALATEIQLALRYLLKIQHDDGTIDLLSTNFHSTPDTGFIVKWLVPVYKILNDANGIAYYSLTGPAQILLTGGRRSPGGRWYPHP